MLGHPHSNSPIFSACRCLELSKANSIVLDYGSQQVVASPLRYSEALVPRPLALVQKFDGLSGVFRSEPGCTRSNEAPRARPVGTPEREVVPAKWSGAFFGETRKREKVVPSAGLLRSVVEAITLRMSPARTFHCESGAFTLWRKPTDVTISSPPEPCHTPQSNHEPLPDRDSTVSGLSSARSSLTEGCPVTIECWPEFSDIVRLRPFVVNRYLAFDRAGTVVAVQRDVPDSTTRYVTLTPLNTPIPMLDWLREVRANVPFVPPVYPDGSTHISAIRRLGDEISDNERCSQIHLGRAWRRHQAFDYFWLLSGIPGSSTSRPAYYPEEGNAGPFPVRAIADGVVIFAGYNYMAGNTVIIHHENGGSPLRSIYAHLTHGPRHDLEMAVTAGDACLLGTFVNEQGNTESLTGWTGCNSDYLASRAKTIKERAVEALQRLSDGESIEARWGTEAHRLRVMNGSMVKRGEIIGFAGRTGWATTGIHLHFEVVKQGNPGTWLRIDPYGIYSHSDFYVGLYPTGMAAVGVGLQRKSLFAPTHPDFAEVSPTIAHAAEEYYRSVGWNVVAAGVADAEGVPHFRAFDRISVPSVAQTNLSLNDFYEVDTVVKRDGYHLHAINATIPTHGSSRLSGVWRQFDGMSRVRSVDLQTGLHLSDDRWYTVDVCPYLLDGQIKFLVTERRAEARVRPNVIAVSTSVRDLAQHKAALGRQGFGIVRLHEYAVQGDRLTVALFMPSTVRTQEFPPTRAQQYAELAPNLRRNGFRPIHMSSTGRGNDVRYLSIWVVPNN